MRINTAAERDVPLFITHFYKRGGIRDGPMVGRASPFVLLTDGAGSGYVLHLHGARGVWAGKRKLLGEAGLGQQVRREAGRGGGGPRPRSRPVPSRAFPPRIWTGQGFTPFPGVLLIQRLDGSK